jgi:hypothetical protein
MATASTLFQRFYHVSSFLDHDIETIVLGALFLSTKIEECHRKLRQVIVVYHHVFSQLTPTHTPLSSKSIVRILGCIDSESYFMNIPIRSKKENY